MDRKTFFDKFDQFADAPDAVARMRELVLDFAVTGKLVPRDPDDKPAAASFPKLALAAIESNDDKFPVHWLTVPLGKIGEWRGGGTPSKSHPDFWKGKIPWVSPKDMKVLHIADAQDHISTAAVEGSSVRMIPTGSLLMVVRGMILARAFPVALTTREVTINQDMKALLPFEAKTKDYLLVALRAFESEILAAIEHSSHGTCKLETEFLQGFAIPLPPLAEQKRIVAKVDELMALCDRLEAQQQERETRHAALARASLARFADAPTPANLNFIFHPSYAIRADDIRMSILTLAVQGLLVRQSEADGNAEDYLPRPTSLQTSALPELPPQWTWTSVNETGRVDLGRQRAPQHHRGPNMRPYLRVQNVYEARIDISDVKTMNFTDTEFETFALMSGDILLNEGQSFKLVGRPAIYRGEVPGACFQNTLVRYRANPFVLPEYALVVFRAYMRNGRFQQISKQTTNIAHLSAGRFAVLEFPLPPLPEQRRIVAKVEQVMALVDTLEQQLAASRATAANLLSALVAELAGIPHNGKVSVPTASGTGRRGRPRKSP